MREAHILKHTRRLPTLALLGGAPLRRFSSPMRQDKNASAQPVLDIIRYRNESQHRTSSSLLSHHFVTLHCLPLTVDAGRQPVALLWSPCPYSSARVEGMSKIG